MQSAGLRTYSIRASLLIGAALINANDRWPWSARFAVIQRSHAGQPALLPTPLHASAHRRTGARAHGRQARPLLKANRTAMAGPPRRKTPRQRRRLAKLAQGPAAQRRRQKTPRGSRGLELALVSKQSEQMHIHTASRARGARYLKKRKGIRQPSQHPSSFFGACEAACGCTTYTGARKFVMSMQICRQCLATQRGTSHRVATSSLPIPLHECDTYIKKTTSFKRYRCDTLT